MPKPKKNKKTKQMLGTMDLTLMQLGGGVSTQKLWKILHALTF